MAVLQKMRDKFGIAISIIIALSLLYFIAPMDDLMTLFGRPQNVGEIAGKGISYEEYQAEVGKFTTLNEIMTGSSVQNEATQKQIQDNAWQYFVDQYLFIPQARKAGIRVGTAELVELTSGSNISPVIAQNPIFQDETGAFSKQLLLNFIQQSHEDETVKLYWDFLQNAISTQQYYAKYATLFSLSAFENTQTLAELVAEGNTTADLDIVSVNYSYAADSTISVSASEIRKYYADHKNQYKQKESRDIEYVVFEVTPSQKDITSGVDGFDKLQAEFAASDNVKSFLMRNSDRSYSEYWYRKGELSTVSTDIDEFAFSGAKGVSKVFKAGNVLRSAKVMATAHIADSVYVKHILLTGAGAKAKADSLCAVVAKKPSKFSALVQEYSEDKGSQADGEIGNIGWLTQTYMIPGLEKVMTTPVGKPVVMSSRYGQHVILVTKATKPQLKKQVAIFEKEIQPSKETFNTYYTQANSFATIANGKLEGYYKAVDSLGVYSHRLGGVLESAESYGSVDNAKEITRWIFDAKAGKASGVITVNNKFFFVAAVKAAHKEGYKPVKEVASSISQYLYNQKKNEKQTAEVAARIEGVKTIEEAAAILGKTVEHMKDVQFSAFGAQSVEPAVLGAAFKAEEGQLCGPVKGIMGTYIVKVVSRNAGSFYTEQDAKNYSSQKAGYSSNMIIPVMGEEAGVTDNRARYY